jgi:hypothetical protein
MKMCINRYDAHNVASIRFHPSLHLNLLASVIGLLSNFKYYLDKKKEIQVINDVFIDEVSHDSSRRLLHSIENLENNVKFLMASNMTLQGEIVIRDQIISGMTAPVMYPPTSHYYE